MGGSPQGYTCQNPLLCVFFFVFFSPRDEKQFSLTKHFPAYLQTGGGAGGREGDWGSSQNVRKVKGCNKGFGASKQIAVKAARGRGEVDEEEGGREGRGRRCYGLLVSFEERDGGAKEKGWDGENECVCVCVCCVCVSLVYVFGDPSM